MSSNRLSPYPYEEQFCVKLDCVGSIYTKEIILNYRSRILEIYRFIPRNIDWVTLCIRLRK